MTEAARKYFMGQKQRRTARPEGGQSFRLVPSRSQKNRTRGNSEEGKNLNSSLGRRTEERGEGLLYGVDLGTATRQQKKR